MKRNIMSIVSVIIFAFIIHCDDNDDFGGGTQDFDTVMAYATYEADTYEADVEIKEDKWDPFDGVCDYVYVTEDDVTITVTSTTKDYITETEGTASSLILIRYKAEFIPLAGSPDVPPKARDHYMKIMPDSTTEVVIRIIDQEDKYLPSHPLNDVDFFASGLGQYQYTIRVSLVMEEAISGDQETIICEFPLNYYDIADDCQ